MKKVFLLIMLSLSMSVHAQKDTGHPLTVREVYEDAKGGFKDAFTGLRSIADKLEGPTKHVYEVYVNQHHTEGLSKLGMMLFLLIFGIPMFVKHVKDVKEEWDYHCTYTIVGGLLCFIGLFSVGVFFWGNGFTEITNPEYFAIQDVIKAFK